MKVQIISTMMMIRNQLFSVTAYSGMFVLSSAFVDYNRDVNNANKNLDDLTSGFAVHQIEDSHSIAKDYRLRMSFTLPPQCLAEKLEQLHNLASRNELNYVDIVTKRDLCLETYNLYLVARKQRDNMVDDEWFVRSQNMTTLSIEEMVARQNDVFTMQMCRRAMLRNGLYIMWFDTFTGRCKRALEIIFN